MTARITDGQKKQIKRFMADALIKTETSKEGAQRLIERGDEFMADIMAVIGRHSAKQPDYTLARATLGGDFISPEEITEARGVSYTDDQIAELERTLPNHETLEWLRDNNFMLVAGSPQAMSLLDIRDLERSYFYSKQGGWYVETNEVFVRNDKVSCRWLMIRKEPVANSTRKTWDEQQRLLTECEMVPNIAEVAWCLTCYKAVRDVYLLGDICVRTSSVDRDGGRVYVGGFGGDRLGVYYWYDGVRDDDLGLASSRKS